MGNGSQEQYFTAIDSVYDLRKKRRHAEDMIKRRGEGSGALIGPPSITWHAKLPPAPPDFLEESTIALIRDAAEFLQDQIVTSQPQSLLSHIIRLPLPEADYPW